MENLSDRTKQELKKYSYQLINIETGQSHGTCKTQAIAARQQKIAFLVSGTVCRIKEIRI